ncbi:MAG: hypothetical protein FJ149_02550 [Euryarchaeota archaeon]|nr:hypothetical protein [Euryarchaeota archaeon]
MKHTGASLAVLIALLFTLPVQAIGGDIAPSVPGPQGGRAPGDPPANGTEWDIVRDYTITGSTRSFSGNITVFTGVNLYIRNNGRLVQPHKADGHWVLFVKAGGNVEVLDNSELDVDHYIAESGTGLAVTNRSAVRANGVFNATSTVYFTDSTLTVTAPSGTAPSEPGEPARLNLDSGSGGTIQRATLSVTGGDGDKGAEGHGTPGGDGGRVDVVVTSKDFFGMRLSARAGNGGTGGSVGATTPDGGIGGRGGDLTIRLVGNGFSNSTINATSGIGGRGADGMMTTGRNGGNGGSGGDGGSVTFNWTGKGIAIAQRSNISVSSGHGGEGGDGGAAQSGNKDGGDGGKGGNGGTVGASIECEGEMSVSDSRMVFKADYGPTGGVFGRAMLGGMDGAAGDGGEGGSCALSLKLNDAFSASNSSLVSWAGGGGAGGLGSTGGKGGRGGSSLLDLSLQTLLSENTVTATTTELVSRAGPGGDGGKGLRIGDKQGQPGDGGKGGGARLLVDADRSITLTGSHVLCDEGRNGTADPPARPGDPGVGEHYFFTTKVNMTRTVYSQTMGWVDNNDLWVLNSSPLVRGNPPLRPPHFLPPTESGVAEEWWMLQTRVRDILGNTITDGTITVEVYRDNRLVSARRTDPLGMASFRLLGSRYSTKPAENVFGVVYNVKAVADDGLLSDPVSVQMVDDKQEVLTIIDVRWPPIVNITEPDPKIKPLLDASQFIHVDGRTDMYLIEGTAQDDFRNSKWIISRVQVIIGEGGSWVDTDFEMVSPGLYKWNHTWDIVNWSRSMLVYYPSGIIPAPIQARAFNDRFWGYAIANITVRLAAIPPAPPRIQITSPAESPSGGTINFTNVPFEKPVVFDGRVLESYGTKVTRWEWDFDTTGGYRADFSSPDSPKTNVSYTRDLNDEYLDVVLKVFDNESARRVELYRAGVPFDSFGYEFDTNDGSVLVKLRVKVDPIPVKGDDGLGRFLSRYGGITFLGIIALVMMVGAAQTYRSRRRHIAERKAKEERETLRIDVSEMKCARCSEPIADPSEGCLKCKAQDELGRVQQRLLDLKGAGINVTDAESLLETGVDAFDAKSYEEAHGKALEAKKVAGELEAKYNETAKVISGWETRIAALKVDRPEADVSDAETRVYHARLALGRGDHVEALRNLDGLEGVLAKADKVGVRRGAEELLLSTKRMLGNLQKRGVVLDGRITSMLSTAETAMERGEYDQVSDFCKEAETLVRENNKMFMRASEQLRQSESRVLNAKGMGQSVGGTEDWLARAKTAMSGGNYAGVLEETGRVLSFFGVAPKPVAAGKKVDWKREAAVLEGREGKPAPARPAVVAPAPAPTLEVEPSPELKEAAERLLRDANAAVAAAREVAVDVTDGKELVEKAKDAYKARRYDEASDLAKSATFLLKELAAAAPRAKPPAAAAPAAPAARPAPAVPARTAELSGAAAELKATIDKANDLLARLAGYGGDISGPETKLTRAKAARDGGSPAVAMQYARESIDETEGLIKEYLDAKTAMDTVEKDLAAAKARGADVEDAEFQLKQGRAAMAGGAFVRAADTAKLVDGMLKELEPAAARPPVAKAEAPAPKAPAAKCPGCGRDAKPHWKTCPFCGASIVGEKPAAPEAPRPPVVVPSPRPAEPEAPRPPVVVPAPSKPAAPAAAAGAPAASCAKCGAALKPHWKVCPSCGSEVKAAAAPPTIAPAVERCPACGSRVEPAWTSCPVCNTALEPDKGTKPEVPKRVLKVAKRPVTPGEPKPEPPKEVGAKAPVVKVVKKPVIVTEDEGKKK